MDNLDAAIGILGSDNIKEIQSALTDMIIDDLRESVKYEWFVLPDEWNTMFEDVCKEVFDSMRKKYKKEMKDLCETKFRQWLAEQYGKEDGGEE